MGVILNFRLRWGLHIEHTISEFNNSHNKMKYLLKLAIFLQKIKFLINFCFYQLYESPVCTFLAKINLNSLQTKNFHVRPFHGCAVNFEYQIQHQIFDIVSRKKTMKERYHRRLTRLLKRDRLATLPQIKADFNAETSTSVSVRGVQGTHSGPEASSEYVDCTP